ncbi:VapE domain-containing protein [Aestuariivirga sp.]|uniref:VapE domain-containing protein n=1 Tax=Aestuariivirga sp. TaxID=2650926 RepID=UPI0039E69724
MHLVSISNNGKVTAKTFDNANDPAVREWIDQRQGKENIYFHINSLYQALRNIKAKKKDIERAEFLHVDIDDANALRDLKEFLPKPTAGVASGGGYNAYWRLAESTNQLDLIERINRGLAQRLGGDHCHNADRIMRVPGTINIPNQKKRNAGRVEVVAHILEEVTDWSRSYKLEEFGQPAKPSDSAETDVAPEHIKTVDLDDLGLQLPDLTKALILAGDDVRHPIGTQNSRYPSRSEAVFRVSCDLVRLGLSIQKAAGILINPRYGISASIREKRDARAYAIRQIKSAQEAISEGWPDVFRGGDPRPTLNNTLLAIKRLGLHAEYDEFHKRKRLGGRDLQQFANELTDDACAVLRHLILKNYGFDPGKDHIREAANILCLENSFHPIRDYLDNLVWDGVERIGSWLTTYLGAPNAEFVRAVGKIMLVAAVRRVRRPGIKFDTIIVLEGTQGSGKSTALRLLAGDENFSDQDILTLDAKAQVEAMAGVWIYELCELEGLHRAESNKVKAFASRAVDRARPSYGRYREDSPRQNIFVGTTNDDKYLRDLTGNRRFWPVKAGNIDLGAIARDRDQLWAEAAYLEAKGESINLPEGLWPEATKEQDARLEDDPWFDQLSDLHGEVFEGDERKSTADILEHCLKLTPATQQAYHTKRLAQIMRKLGWEGPKLLKFSKGAVARGYRRPAGSGGPPNTDY